MFGLRVMIYSYIVYATFSFNTWTFCIMKCYKYRLTPNAYQKQLLAQNFGCARMIYNWGLWLSKEKYPWRVNLANQLKEKKKELPRLKDCYSQVLQQSLKNLDIAFQRFFKKKSKYPNFKKKSNTQSIRYPQFTSITDMHIKLPKIWEIKCVFHRECKGKIKSMTITKTATWKYYVSILTDYTEQKPSWVWSVGIDVGIKTFAVCSDGQQFENPKYLRKAMRRLKKQQRRLSRKQKWSANKTKQRLIVARLHEKVSNQRQDFLHKTSTTISRMYEVACLEKLNIKWMMKNHCLAQSISDVWRWMFKTMLQYKMEVKEIWTFKPSSKTCSNCWNIKKDLKLSDRTYHCEACWIEIDRDYNASINIKAMATVEF